MNCPRMRTAFEAEFAPLALDIKGSGSDTERGDDFKVTIVSNKFVGHGCALRAARAAHGTCVPQPVRAVLALTRAGAWYVRIVQSV